MGEIESEVDRHAALRAAGLVSRKQRVKVLGRGDVTKALTVRAHKFSGKAAEKIAAAGGATEVLALKAAPAADKA